MICLISLLCTLLCTLGLFYTSKSLKTLGNCAEYMSPAQTTNSLYPFHSIFPLYSQFSLARIAQYTTVWCVYTSVYPSLKLRFPRFHAFAHKLRIFISRSERFRAAFFVFGGAVSSTEGLKKQYQRELQKLRGEYLRSAADPAEAAKLEEMIKRRKELLAQLGGK